MHGKQAFYLIVRVAGRLCALPIAQVIEVLRLSVLEAPDFADLGQGPQTLLGILPWRGQQISALELSLLLGFDVVARNSSGGRLVATRLAGQIVALAVEEVIGVEPLAPESLTAISLPAGAEQTLGRFDAGFARLIDASGTLADEVAATFLHPAEVG